MKYPLNFGILACLVCSALLFGQGNPSSTEQKQEPLASNSNTQEPKQPKTAERYGPIDILTDTKGVDVHDYLYGRLLPKVKANWYKQIPESAHPPIMKKGKVLIRFRVMKNGDIRDVQYSASSGDPALDRAAYGGITDSNPLPPLPSEFACQYLALQIHFYYNPARGDVEDEKATSTLPCVTTTIRSGGEVGVTVSPTSAQVVAGEKQQFLAAVTGDMNSGVSWSIGGSGCAASTCGVISGDGLYTAPIVIPNPATITVTATLAAAPSQTASATVTIVQSSPSH